MKVLVVGNPANTNALIAYRNAPDLDPGQFTAMTRFDHNRAISELAAKTGKHSLEVDGMIIWGKSTLPHSDIHHALSPERRRWSGGSGLTVNDFIPSVQQRGATYHQGAGGIFGSVCG